MVPNVQLSTNYGLGWFWIIKNIFQWSNSQFYNWLTTANAVPSPSPCRDSPAKSEELHPFKSIQTYIKVCILLRRKKWAAKQKKTLCTFVLQPASQLLNFFDIAHNGLNCPHSVNLKTEWEKNIFTHTRGFNQFFIIEEKMTEKYQNNTNYCFTTH